LINSIEVCEIFKTTVFLVLKVAVIDFADHATPASSFPRRCFRLILFTQIRSSHSPTTIRPLPTLEPRYSAKLIRLLLQYSATFTYQHLLSTVRSRFLTPISTPISTPLTTSNGRVRLTFSTQPFSTYTTSLSISLPTSFLDLVPRPRLPSTIHHPPSPFLTLL